jgi:hypothetical protein
MGLSSADAGAALAALQDKLKQDTSLRLDLTWTLYKDAGAG